MTTLVRLSLFTLLLVLVAGCGDRNVVSKAQFTREYAAAAWKAAPHLRIEVVRTLEVKATGPEGISGIAYLDNAYDEYRQAPETKDAIFAKHTEALSQATKPLPEQVDRTRIIPVVKDRGWLADMRQTQLAQGGKENQEPFHEELGPDLVVVYAEDMPTSIRYLSAADLTKAGVDGSGLRALACENLQRLQPEPKRHGEDGVYMLTLDGTFEASLLLYPKLWTPERMPVKGEIVVAVPNRDLLFVTGSGDAAGLEKIEALAKKSWETGTYRLTPKLFVFRGGRLEEFARKR